MIEQIQELIQRYGNDAIVKNPAIPNEQNEAVATQTGKSLMYGLQEMASSGNFEQLAGLFNSNNLDSSNPGVSHLNDKVSGDLMQKFGMDSATSKGLVASLIPMVLGALMGKAKDSSDSSFNISDIIAAISGGSGNSAGGAGGGLMDSLSKYGASFGLDSNSDGKVDLGDAGGLLDKMFGK